MLGAEARGAVRRASGLGDAARGGDHHRQPVLRHPSVASVFGATRRCGSYANDRGLSVFSFCAKLLLQSGAIKPAQDTSLAVPAEGWHGIFYVSICIFLYLIHGLTQGTREGTRVKVRSYLILQNQAFDAGCRQRLPPECSPDGNGSRHVCE